MILVGFFQFKISVVICDISHWDKPVLSSRRSYLVPFPTQLSREAQHKLLGETAVSCSLASSFPDWHSPDRSHIYREPGGPWLVRLPRNLSCLNSQQPTEIKSQFDLAVTWKWIWTNGMMWEVSESCLKADMLNLRAACAAPADCRVHAVGANPSVGCKHPASCSYHAEQ